MTKNLLVATAVVWWSAIAGAVHAPSTANAQIAEANAQITEHRITVFHTNDLQGGIYAADGFDERDQTGNRDLVDTVEQGGLAALASMIRAHGGAGGDSILVLDGGNAMGASPACDVDGCRTLFELMNLAGYDAMAVGGQEFTYGRDTLATRAGQADFQMLGANLAFGDALDGTIAPFLLTERRGLQIAVLGLASSRMTDDLASVGPAVVEIHDPRETLESLLAGPAGRADVRIALVNMRMDEARDLAMAFPQIHLFIAGGTVAGPEPRPGEHAVRFADGRYLVTTPGRGTHLGRLGITIRREGGKTTLSDLSAVLVPAGSSAPRDPAVSAVVTGLRETVRRAYGVRIGQTRAPIEDTRSWIADLARTKLAADVAAIDRNTVRPIRLDGEVRLRTVMRLVRGNDALVRVSVLGRHLRTWTDRLLRERDVVFAGYDPESGSVDGRPLNRDRTYVVAVPMTLTDRELIRTAGDIRTWSVPGTRIGLRDMVAAHVRINGKVDRWEGIRRGPRSVMEGSTRLDASLSQTTLEGPADQYSRDPFLSGEEALSWLVRVEHHTTRYTPAGTFSAQLRTGYGRLNNNGSQREAVDRIDGELLYSLPSAQLSPFVGFDVNTVWTGDEGRQHPVVLRVKSGLQTELGSRAIVRVGLALERDRITAMNVVGVEVAPEYRTTLLPGNTLSSQARVFWGTGPRQTISVQHYNHLRFRLLGDLAATLDANIFLHRDSDVDRSAVKFELQVGLGYDWRYYR